MRRSLAVPLWHPADEPLSTTITYAVPLEIFGAQNNYHSLLMHGNIHQ